MTILHVITQSKLAGAEMLMLRLCTWQQQHGHRVLIAARPGAALDEEVRQRDLECVKLPIQGKFNLSALGLLSDLARRRQVDVIHTHNSTASLWGGRCGRRLRLPAVAHVHGFCTPITMWCFYSHVHQLVAVSEAVRRHVLAMGFPENRVRCVHNPLPLNAFRPQRAAAEVRRELGLSNESVVFGAFAHLSPKKGYVELLRAIAIARHNVPAARWIIAGDGPQRQRLLELRDQLGLQSIVQFVGFRRDVADLMNAVDVCVLASRREPFGLVYLEAMSLAKPVIACRSGGAPEVVVDGVSGLLVPPCNPHSLAAAMQRLAHTPDLRAKLGAAGRQRVENHFTIEQAAEQLDRIYHQVRCDLRRRTARRTPVP